MSKPNKWFPLFSTQFLGVLNDNFLKNCIIFVSIFWLAEDDQGMIIPIASALLVLPFVLCSPLAGRMAQTYSKQRIYEYAKLVEIPIMVIAISGFYMEHIWMVMFALLLMGFQSAIYAPSKYGLIRDVGGSDGLSYGVGTMELLTFLGVLIAQVAAGLVSDLSQGVTTIVATVLIVLAILGYLTSRKIKVKEEQALSKPEGSIEPFTFLFKTARWANDIKGLNTTIIGLGSFWFVAAMIQMNILEHAPNVYHLSNTGTSIVMALVAIGIGLGCFISGALSKTRVELGMVPLGGLGLSILLTIFATVELSLYPFVVCLFFAAMFSGFYKVPLSAWIQERVEGRKLGRALAYNQLVAFLFILVAAVIFGYVVNAYGTFTVFVVLAVVSWVMTLITLVNIPAMMLRFVAYILTNTYYKIEVEGAHHIPRKTGALIVANHISLMDPLFMVAAVPRMLRFVMAQKIYEFWLFNWLMKKLNMIPISQKLDKVKLDEFNNLCRNEVNKGHVLTIFPEGQISRIGHLLEFKRGIEHIAKGVDVPIIPVQMEGVSGTPLSFEIGTSKTNKSWRSSFRKRISIQIGAPLPADSKAELLRQKVQYLNARTFERRIRDHHTLLHFMKKSVVQFKKSPFMTGSVSHSYRSFYKEAGQKTGFWNITQKEHVGIDLGNHEQLGLIHVSCLIAGKIPVFFNPHMDENTKSTIIETYGLDCILSCEKTGGPYHHPDRLLNSTQERHSICKSSDSIGVFWDQPSDGTWTALSITHANVLATIRGFMHLFKRPTDAVLYSDFPAYTSYGNINNIWLPFFFGMSVYQPKHGADIAKEWTQSGINTLFTEARLIEDLQGQLETSHWDQMQHVILGREQLPAALMEQLTDHGIFISASLGIPNGGSVIAMNTPDYEVVDLAGTPMIQEGGKRGSYGRALPGIGIKIVDEEGRDMPLGEVGDLHVYGPGICNDHKTADGWLPTGLKAYSDEKGFIHLP
jgi:acyl-[acyl-carrier-protein]-phospholipid O-acyltransferase/long-chain-fatty-acid--[acyl-carrier-protein] ligase